MSDIAYLSLGSNLGPRGHQLRAAISLLGRVSKVLSVSSFYETQPVEVTDQPWFLNCALTVETDLSPERLVDATLAIEREMGRERTRTKGPRNIDIDILLFGKRVLDSPRLTLPHPAMHQRRFVLEPLAEIAADAHHPVLNKTVRELLSELKTDQVVRRMVTQEPD